MTRRTLLSCLAGLPFLGWLRPSEGRPGHSVPLAGEDGWHHMGMKLPEPSESYEVVLLDEDGISAVRYMVEDGSIVEVGHAIVLDAIGDSVTIPPIAVGKPVLVRSRGELEAE